jgi:DNA-binding XRE family transcriptional regulator
MSQAQFAQLLGVHWVTVSRWERGELKPSPYQQEMISKFQAASRHEKDIGQKAANELLVAGAIAALLLLLIAANSK